jgi:cytochrome P450
VKYLYAFMPHFFVLGQKYALMEQKVVISTVLRRYRIEAAHSRNEAILQVSYKYHLYIS